MTEEQRAEIIKKIQKLCLMDDFFMTRFFEDNIEGVQLVLSIILNRNDLIVKKVDVEKDIKSLVGHGVRLDVLAIDQQGKYYNIEVQKASDGAVPLREMKDERVKIKNCGGMFHKPGFYKSRSVLGACHHNF